MFKLKLLILALFVLVLIGIGWWFGSENTQAVSPNAFGLPLPTLSLGAWLSVMLLVGAIIGYLVSLISYIKIKGQNLNLQRKLQQREQEVTKLRTASLRG